MKPGKPTTFATISKPSGEGQCAFFGLPGNPVSCLVCKALVVDPALKRLQGLPSKGLCSLCPLSASVCAITLVPRAT
jgi:molybdopterin biosynthesis enzyme